MMKKLPDYWLFFVFDNSDMNKSPILQPVDQQLYDTTLSITASYLQLHLYKREPALCNKNRKN